MSLKIGIQNSEQESLAESVGWLVSTGINVCVSWVLEDSFWVAAGSMQL